MTGAFVSFAAQQAQFIGNVTVWLLWVLAILDTHRYQSSYCAWLSFIVKPKKYIRIIAMDWKRWLHLLLLLLLLFNYYFADSIDRAV